MRQIAALAASLFLAAAGAAHAVEGRYAVQGTNPDGSTYEGAAEIVAISEVTCEITWITGDTESTGVCMRYHNAFAAAYVLNEDIGLLIYEIMDDGSMRGTWTIAGQDGVGEEVLIPQ